MMNRKLIKRLGLLIIFFLMGMSVGAEWWSKSIINLTNPTTLNFRNDNNIPSPSTCSSTPSTENKEIQSLLKMYQSKILLMEETITHLTDLFKSTDIEVNKAEEITELNSNNESTKEKIRKTLNSLFKKHEISSSEEDQEKVISSLVRLSILNENYNNNPNQEELLLNDIEEIFESYGISLEIFYTELLNIKDN